MFKNIWPDNIPFDAQDKPFTISVRSLRSFSNRGTLLLTALDKTLSNSWMSKRMKKCDYMIEIKNDKVIK